MSRVVDVSVVCERCKARHPLGDPKLEGWQLDVPVRVGELQAKGDYCAECFTDLVLYTPEGTRAPTTADGSYVCDQPGCGRTFATKPGIGNHLARTHGIRGPRSKAKPKAKRKPTRAEIDAKLAESRRARGVDA